MDRYHLKELCTGEGSVELDVQ